MGRKVVCVTGGRAWGLMEIRAASGGMKPNEKWREQRALVNSALCFVALWWPQFELIHGDGDGADWCAENWYVTVGKFLEVARTPYPANWRELGRVAGMSRNETMALRMPDLVIAFPGSTGTADMKRRVLSKGLYLIEVGNGTADQWGDSPGMQELLSLGKTSRRSR